MNKILYITGAAVLAFILFRIFKSKVEKAPVRTKEEIKNTSTTTAPKKGGLKST